LCLNKMSLGVTVFLHCGLGSVNLGFFCSGESALRLIKCLGARMCSSIWGGRIKERLFFIIFRLVERCWFLVARLLLVSDVETWLD
jgi:hypothetical protein